MCVDSPGVVSVLRSAVSLLPTSIFECVVGRRVALFEVLAFIFFVFSGTLGSWSKFLTIFKVRNTAIHDHLSA